MDALDHRIIAAMAAEGRITLQELAERVRLGASATRERLRRLERDGVISGYRAIVDETAVGYPLEALVEVDLAAGADMQEFENRLRALPAVVEVLHATGDWDYLVRLRCTDTGELHRSVRRLKTELGAVRTITRVVLERPVAARPRLPGAARSAEIGPPSTRMRSSG